MISSAAIYYSIEQFVCTSESNLNFKLAIIKKAACHPQTFFSDISHWSNIKVGKKCELHEVQKCSTHKKHINWACCHLCLFLTVPQAKLLWLRVKPFCWAKKSAKWDITFIDFDIFQTDAKYWMLGYLEWLERVWERPNLSYWICTTVVEFVLWLEIIHAWILLPEWFFVLIGNTFQSKNKFFLSWISMMILLRRRLLRRK